MGTTILRRHLGRKALGLCLLLFGFTPTWAATVSINSVTYTGGSFLIASDASNPAAGYDRDTIPVSVSAAFSGTAFSEPVRSYRVRFRILDDLGAEVSLASGTSVSPSVIWPSSFAQFTGQPLPSTVTFTGTPTPSVRLDVNRTYRVEAQVLMPQSRAASKIASASGWV